MDCDGNIAICSSTTLIGSIEIPNVAVIVEETFESNWTPSFVNSFVPSEFGAFNDDGIADPQRQKIALGFSYPISFEAIQINMIFPVPCSSQIKW